MEAVLRMPPSEMNTLNRLRAWAAPMLLAALLAICGYLWVDQVDRMNRMNDRLETLNDAVVRLTALTERQP